MQLKQLLLSLVLVGFAAAQVTVTTATATMGTYPGYSGSHSPSGELTLSESGSALMISGTVTGLPASCTDCGLHVHVGYSCATHAQVGGHYWRTGTDPWIPVYYNTTSAGSATVDLSLSSLSLTLKEMTGRTVVFHDQSGTRVACGQILPPTSSDLAYASLTPYPTSGLLNNSPTLATFAPYPGYTGSLAVTGTTTATKHSDGVNFTITYSLAGLEASTSGGIHIHSGKTCATAADVGGHYWQPTNETDPWSTTWMSDASGDSAASFNIDFGYTEYSDIESHAVVIHASDGTRVACGTLAYQGNANGYVMIAPSATAGSIALYMTATGLETAPSSTGSFHAHVGSTCETAGAHLDNNQGVDPWGSAQSYTVDQTQLSEFSVARAYTDVDVAGYDAVSDLQSRTIVIHASNGMRLACGQVVYDASTAAAVPTMATALVVLLSALAAWSF